MLGRTAGNLYWTFRCLERAENMTRLIDAGFRISLTRSGARDTEWISVLSATSSRAAYDRDHETFDNASVVNFLLRGTGNPSSVLACVHQARTNARACRTALTREVWEAVNECWIQVSLALKRTVRLADLPDILRQIRQHCALVRGALHGTMLRNDIFGFCQAGLFVERADATARILDVKYYVLLPSVGQVGSPVDNVQWETILRATSAERAFNWLHGGETSARLIADFLIFDRRMPRSLAFCYEQLAAAFEDIGRHACAGLESCRMILAQNAAFGQGSITGVFDHGLHEFILEFITGNNALGRQIEQDFRFLE